MRVLHDVIIIGTGLAGLTAGLYTTRARLSTLLLEKSLTGGELVNRDIIENYPGFPNGILGKELKRAIVDQLSKYDPEIELTEAKQIRLEGQYKVVKTIRDDDYLGKAVIIAGGANNKKLGIPGEEEFLDQGVFYCATCDGLNYINKMVAVVGGGDSGVTEALYLTRIVSKVTIIELMPHLTATKILQERVFSNPKINVICDTKIERIIGDQQVKAIKIVNGKTGYESTLEVDGVLIRVGLDPNTSYLKDTVLLNEKGQILVNENMETNIQGIFAAGDIRSQSPMQFATAVGDGATAAISIQKYLQRLGMA